MIDKQTKLFLYFIAFLVLITGGGLAGLHAVRSIIGVPKLVTKTILLAFAEPLGVSPIFIEVAVLLGTIGIVVIIGVTVWAKLSDWLQSF